MTERRRSALRTNPSNTEHRPSAVQASHTTRFITRINEYDFSVSQNSFNHLYPDF